MQQPRQGGLVTSQGSDASTPTTCQERRWRKVRTEAANSAECLNRVEFWFKYKIRVDANPGGCGYLAPIFSQLEDAHV